MSDHVLKTGECPTCDASEISQLRASFAAAVRDLDAATRRAESHLAAYHAEHAVAEGLKISQKEAESTIRSLQANFDEEHAALARSDAEIARLRSALEEAQAEVERWQEQAHVSVRRAEAAEAGNASLLKHHQAEDARLSAERDEALSRADALQAEVESLRAGISYAVKRREEETARADALQKERDALVALQQAAAEITGAAPGVLAHSCSGVASCLACGKVATDWRARADAAWRAGVEAAAKWVEARGPVSGWCGYTVNIAHAIRALPPPSAPADDTNHKEKP